MVGDIITEFVFQKVVRQENFMLKYGGVGVSKSLILDLSNRGVKLLRFIRCVPGKQTKVYYATIKQYLDTNIRFNNPSIDKDDQLLVKLENLIEG